MIARMLRTSFSGAEIARTLSKDPSAVNRHIKQSGGRERYDAREVRRRKRHKRIAAMDNIRILKGTLLRSVSSLLKEHYSPEQIAGVLAQKGQTIVASTIYRFFR